jgi:hypothetical protein
MNENQNENPSKIENGDNSDLKPSKLFLFPLLFPSSDDQIS